MANLKKILQHSSKLSWLLSDIFWEKYENTGKIWTEIFW